MLPQAPALLPRGLAPQPVQPGAGLGARQLLPASFQACLLAQHRGCDPGARQLLSLYTGPGDLSPFPLYLRMNRPSVERPGTHSLLGGWRMGPFSLPSWPPPQCSIWRGVGRTRGIHYPPQEASVCSLARVLGPGLPSSTGGWSSHLGLSLVWGQPGEGGLDKQSQEQRHCKEWQWAHQAHLKPVCWRSREDVRPGLACHPPISLVGWTQRRHCPRSPALASFLNVITSPVHAYRLQDPPDVTTTDKVVSGNS